jgi:beta-phosphoglucomutase
MIKGIIFDMDGVIVDTAIFHFKAWRRLAEELSIDIDENFNENLKGLSRVDSLDVILQKGDLILDNLTKHKLMEQKNAWYLEFVNDMQPSDVLPGVPEFFAEINKRGLKKALGSSSRNAEIILDKLGMRHEFDAIIDGNKVTLSKPDPEVFIKGAQELGLDPSEIVVFEDAVAGVQAAKSGGFRVIGVGSEDVLDQADLVISDMSHSNFELLNRV